MSERETGIAGRQAVRLRTGTVVHGIPIGESTAELVGVLTDVSETGVGCQRYSDQRVPDEGERFVVVFVLPNGRIDASAEVVWTDVDRWGMSIEPAGDSSRERLERYCAAPW